ncbi:MAG: ATP-grasp domain-containing protein, partial [Candidatus Marinimicrobia bacterium]|nr:ATP-grasp domain-containing protein [Candidatus Neomarinimicrobiota bacterium]
VDPIPGSPESLSSVESAVVAAKEIGFPVLLKAASGGGGKGIRIVRSAKELPAMFETASSEAYSSFNDPDLFIERYIESPHHVEFQILGDKDGNVVHLGDRECSVQRRYQKVIEESPSPYVPDKIREEIGSYAVEIAKSAGYYSAGTVEFIVDNNLNFYFLEMNTRLQVEHPVTEMRTGVDIVKEQINIAEGNKLPFGQHEITYSGHAIECRITAEDALNDFLPDSGTIDNYIEPGGPGIRIDSGVQNDSEISPYYDPLISKLIAWGNDRVESIARCRRALSEYIITGISTSIPFCVSALMNDKFVKGDYDTNIAGEIIKEMPSQFEEKAVDAAAIGAAAYTAMDSQNGKVSGSAGQSIFKSWKMHGRKSALR